MLDPSSFVATRPPSRWPERLFTALTRSAGFAILTAVFGLIGILFVQSWPALLDAGHNGLFTSSEWKPDPPGGGAKRFGSLAFVYGTLVTSAIAMLLAVPLGVASAVFLSEVMSGWLRRVGMFLIELLAAIPSVVYGFWGLTVLAPAVQKLFDLLGGPNTGGNGIFAAGLVLAVMILPYITAISFDVIQAVPRASREGALALGASRWQAIWRVVLPTARPGIVAASFLALGRALGETMAVTMLIGNKSVWEFSLFAYGDTIASKMANSFAEASDPKTRSALLALALVLFLVTAATNLLARFMLARLTRRPRRGIPVTVEPNPADHELPSPPAAVPPPRSHAALWNRVMMVVLAGCTLVTVVPLFLILGLITVKGVQALESSLFRERARPNLSNEQYEQYRAWQRGEAERPLNEFDFPVRRGGLGHAMLGSVVLVIGATLLAVPLGLVAAIWLAEARQSRMAAVTRLLTELLGGVPSIVIGLFVYSILVAPTYSVLRGADAEPLKVSAWAGMAALALLMVPVVVRSSEEAMKLVPNAMREASYALGATRMQTTLRVIMPAAMPAVVTGVFLAIGRIAGETAPLIFTAGQSDDWPNRTQSLNRSFPYLTGYINDYAQSAYQDYKDQAWGGTLVLLGVVMLLNIGIRLMAGKRVVAASRGG
jgi:phosphate transport system permease protein